MCERYRSLSEEGGDCSHSKAGSLRSWQQKQGGQGALTVVRLRRMLSAVFDCLMVRLCEPAPCSFPLSLFARWPMVQGLFCGALQTT